MVDEAQGVGDVEQSIRQGAADVELRGAVRLPRAVSEREPDAGGVRGADLGSEDGYGAPYVAMAWRSPSVIARVCVTSSGCRAGLAAASWSRLCSSTSPSCSLSEHHNSQVEWLCPGDRVRKAASRAVERREPLGRQDN